MCIRDSICTTFAALVDKALADGEEMLVILAHGGTQMAALERYALPHRDYYAWCGPNAGGFVLDARDWQREHILHLVKTVQLSLIHICGAGHFQRAAVGGGAAPPMAGLATGLRTRLRV